MKRGTSPLDGKRKFEGLMPCRQRVKLTRGEKAPQSDRGFLQANEGPSQSISFDTQQSPRPHENQRYNFKAVCSQRKGISSSSRQINSALDRKSHPQRHVTDSNLLETQQSDLTSVIDNFNLESYQQSQDLECEEKIITFSEEEMECLDEIGHDYYAKQLQSMSCRSTCYGISPSPLNQFNNSGRQFAGESLEYQQHEDRDMKQDTLFATEAVSPQYALTEASPCHNQESYDFLPDYSSPLSQTLSFTRSISTEAQPSLSSQVQMDLNIIQYMREKDQPAVSREAYDLTKNSEGFLSLRERVAIVGWMQQYCARAEIQKLTFSLSLVIFDNLINSMSLANNDKTRSQQKIEALAVCSLFIACKIEEVKPPSLSSLVLCVSNTNTLEQLVECESQIFKTLEWNINMPTHHFWLNVLTQQLQKSNEKTGQRDPLKCDESLATAIIYNKTVTVLDLVLLDLEASTFASFDLTISILYFTYMLAERSQEVVLNSGPEQHPFETLLSNKWTRLNIKFRLLLSSLFKDGQHTDISILANCLCYLKKYSSVFEAVARDQDEMTMVGQTPPGRQTYSLYQRAEVTELILGD